jgi:hypothetical protein
MHLAFKLHNEEPNDLYSSSNSVIYIYMCVCVCGCVCVLTAIGLPSGGSSTVQIYIQTIYRTTQLTTLVGRFSGIRTHSGQTKINDELRKNYRLMGRCSGDQIEANEMGWACSAYGREVYTGFLWGNESKRPLGRPRRRWEDNIKMDL